MNNLAAVVSVILLLVSLITGSIAGLETNNRSGEVTVETSTSQPTVTAPEPAPVTEHRRVVPYTVQIEHPTIVKETVAPQPTPGVPQTKPQFEAPAPETVVVDEDDALISLVEEIIATLEEPVEVVSPEPEVELATLAVEAQNVVQAAPKAQHTEYTSAPVNQGDVYYTDRGSACTIGYVDKVNRIAYTAAHCALDKNPRTLNDFHGNVVTELKRDREQMGTMIHPSDYLRPGTLPDYSRIKYAKDTPVDIAAIKLWDSAPVGENSFSGDTMLTYHDVRVGDTACYVGAKDGLQCGRVLLKEAKSRQIFVTTDSKRTSHPGDSGGAVWIPGKGAFGVLAGPMRASNGDVGITAVGF